MSQHTTSTDVDVAVIGGGAFGTSIAFHLARDTDLSVRVIERFGVSEGTTWHSAGMVGQLRSKDPIMQVIRHSAALYASLEEGTPGLLDFRRVGSLRIATTPIRVAEMTEQVAQARALGIDAEMIAPDRIAEIVPTLDTDQILAACWIASDGYVDPEQLAVGLAQRAVELGAQISTGTTVTALTRTDEGHWVIETDGGTVTAAQVVLAGGMHTTVLARQAGAFVPLLCSRQQLIYSNPIDPEVAGYPTVREPDESMIMRASGDRLVVGSYVEDPEFDVVDDVPVTARYLFEPEFDRMIPAWDACVRRFPVLAEVGVDRVIKGPEGVTPDGEIIMAPAGPEGLWIAAGGSGHGIASAGGVGWVMSTWLATGTPPIDVTDFALDRFPASFETDPEAMLAETRLHEIGRYAPVTE